MHVLGISFYPKEQTTDNDHHKHPCQLNYSHGAPSKRLEEWKRKKKKIKTVKQADVSEANRTWVHWLVSLLLGLAVENILGCNPEGIIRIVFHTQKCI